MRHSSYILITPARNEEAFIEKTIQSVLSQTVLPQRWVIVSDRSTDRTDEIVRAYAGTYSFIRLLRVEEEKYRNFGGKVNAFNMGYESVQNESFDFLGNLDADVSFERTYFETILNEFMNNENLGIAGGIIEELINNQYVCQNISLNSVAGAVQLFRKECYAHIGGYQPMDHGGEDAAAEILARASGWDVRTFPECSVLHHRRVTTGKRNVVSTRFYQGITNYLLGYSPIFHILRSFARMAERPPILGSSAAIAGYLFACMQRRERRLPDTVIKFLRNEQHRRLRSYIAGGNRV